jgi:hypothetical protein
MERQPVTSVPDITRLLARIQDWQADYEKPGGRADAARRIEEARQLLDEIERVLVEMRRELMGGTRRR